MKSYRIDVDYVFGGNDNNPLITDFIKQFSDILYSGKGGTPTFLKNVKVSPDFALKCMVGIPEEEFTPARRALAEAFCQHFMKMKTHDLWTTSRPWTPANPLRVEAPLYKCICDEEWILTFGLSRGRWESDILMSTSALVRQAKFPNRDGIFEQNARLLLALAIYGFADPWQFFTAPRPPQ